jgi:uncharacterized SAM-binding protein YcdF (DUF218 family)
MGVFALFIWARPLLMVCETPRPADAILLLGGGLEDRARVAADLFQQGFAPFILITGAGDCELNRRRLMKHGVPEAAIEVECRSRSTWENAQFSLPLLRERAARRVLLVTTWYHTRRAVAVFRSSGAEIDFSPVATRHHLVNDLRPAFTTYAARRVFAEYAKIVWYRVRHGISPRLPTAPNSRTEPPTP